MPEAGVGDQETSLMLVRRRLGGTAKCMSVDLPRAVSMNPLFSLESSRAVLSSRNIMHATHVTLNFLVDTFLKK